MIVAAPRCRGIRVNYGTDGGPTAEPRFPLKRPAAKADEQAMRALEPQLRLRQRGWRVAYASLGVEVLRDP